MKTKIEKQYDAKRAIEKRTFDACKSCNISEIRRQLDLLNAVHTKIGIPHVRMSDYDLHRGTLKLIMVYTNEIRQVWPNG